MNRDKIYNFRSSTKPKKTQATRARIMSSNQGNTNPKPTSSSRAESISPRSPEPGRGNFDHVTGMPANSAQGAASTDRSANDMAEIKDLITSLSSQMNQRFDAIELEFNIMKREIAESKATICEIETAVSHNSDDISEIKNDELPALKATCERLIKELDEKVLSLELYQRKQNLLLYGVKELHNENIYEVVNEVMSHFLKIPTSESSKIALVNAHRLPPPQYGIGSDAKIRPIIIKFGNMADHDRLLFAFEESQRKRPGRPAPASSSSDPTGAAPAPSTPFDRVSVRQDLPRKMKQTRGKLSSLAYKLRKEHHLSTRIRQNGTKLYLQTRKPTNGEGQAATWTTWTKDTQDT